MERRAILAFGKHVFTSILLTYVLVLSDFLFVELEALRRAQPSLAAFGSEVRRVFGHRYSEIALKQRIVVRRAW